MSENISSKVSFVAGLIVLAFLLVQAMASRAVGLAPTGGESNAASEMQGLEWTDRSAYSLTVKIYAPDWGERHPNGLTNSNGRKALTEFDANEAIAYRWQAMANFYRRNGFLTVKTYAPDFGERHPNGFLTNSIGRKALTEFDATEAMAYRWQAMANFYGRNGFLTVKTYAPDFGERHPNGFLTVKTYAPDWAERHPNGLLAVKIYPPDWAERHPNGLNP